MRLRIYYIMLWLMLAGAGVVVAQPAGNAFKLKEGGTYLELDKRSSKAALDSFQVRYSLFDLPLQRIILQQWNDSLRIKGWQILRNDEERMVLFQQLGSEWVPGEQDFVHFPGFVARALQLAGLGYQQAQQAGANRWRRRHDFDVQDSVVSFYLRGFGTAREVKLAGSFTNWQAGAFAMQRHDSGWVARVILPPGKHFYKFIVDGKWMTDPDNLLEENDGRGNTNSVYFKTNHVFRLAGYTQARQVQLAGSFNQWNADDIAMQRSSHGWQLPAYLPDGTYTYRYVVDGKWMADPGNADKFPNEYNDFNSVVRIGKPFVFKLDGFADARKVTVMGNFNDWKKDELQLTRTADGWVLPYQLGAGNYEYVYLVDGQYVKASAPGQPEGVNFSFSLGANHRFVLKGHSQARYVALSGSFNNWAPATFTMQRQGEDWVLDVYLQPGKQLYKFVVDGKWILDPANKDWEENEHHSGNSVLWKE